MLVARPAARRTPSAPASASRAGSRSSREAPAGEERKVVSVLFVDLVGFTDRSDRADPEDVRATLRPYHERVKADIERFGGTVEKFIGDAVMAVFGAPARARGRRGARRSRGTADPRHDRGAARRRARARRPCCRHDGRGGRRARRASGARRRHRHGRRRQHRRASAVARPRSAGCIVDETTMRSAERAITFEPLDPVEAKGKAEPIPVWRGVDARSRVGAARGCDARRPFVGREHERTLLLETFLACRARVVGSARHGRRRAGNRQEPARHGASRPRSTTRPDLVRWRHGRCLPYGEGITFWALGEIVKAEAGILESRSTRPSRSSKLDETDRGVSSRTSRSARGSPRGSHRSSVSGGDGGAAAVRRRSPPGGASSKRWLRGGPCVLVDRGPPLGGRRAARVPRAPPRLEHAGARFSSSARLARSSSSASRAGVEGSGTRRRSRSRRSPIEEAGAPPPGSCSTARSFPPRRRRRSSSGPAGTRSTQSSSRACSSSAATSRASPCPRRCRRSSRRASTRSRPELKALLHDASVVGRVFWTGALADDGRARSRRRAARPQRARAPRVRPAGARLVDGRGGRVLVLARARPRRRVPADPARRRAPRSTSRLPRWVEATAERADRGPRRDPRATTTSRRSSSTEAAGEERAGARGRPRSRSSCSPATGRRSLDTEAATAYFRRAVALAGKDELARATALGTARTRARAARRPGARASRRRRPRSSAFARSNRTRRR